MIGWVNVVEKQLTVTAELYAANDCVGGLIILPGAVASKHFIGILESFVLIDQAMQSAALRVFIFDSIPTGTYVDGTELDVTDADMLNCIGAFDLAATDWYNCKDNGVACLRNLGIPLRLTSSTLYLLIKCTGAPTFVAITDLLLKAGLIGT